MSKWFKRVLSVVLVCVFIGGAVPMGTILAVAADAGSNMGGEENPFSDWTLTLDDFASAFSSNTAFDVKLAYQSARAAEDAYGISENAFVDNGFAFENVHPFDSDILDIHVLCGIKTGIDLNGNIKKIFAISFRGSQTGWNWAANFDFAPEPWILNHDVHEGFLACYREFRNSIVPKINAEYGNILGSSSSDVAYWVSGHSLGGALAEMFTIDRINNGVSPNNMICYTVGAPPVGSKELYNYANAELHASSRIHKIMNTNDIVPSAGVNAFTMANDVFRFTSGNDVVTPAVMILFLAGQLPLAVGAEALLVPFIMHNHSCKDTYIQYLRDILEGEVPYPVQLTYDQPSQIYQITPTVSGIYTFQSSEVRNWDGFAPNAYLTQYDVELDSDRRLHSTSIQLSYNSFLITYNLIAGETYCFKATSDYAPGTGEFYNYTFTITAPKNASSGANIDSARAYSIYGGQTIEVELSKGATSRYYKIIPTVSGVYTFESSVGTYSRGNNVKNAYLYDSAMNLLDASTPQAPNSLVLEYRSFKITYNLVAGNTYYFRATSTNSSETGEIYGYTFTITAPTKPSSGANSNSGNAYTIQAGQTIDVELSKGATSRYYKITPTVSGVYIFESSVGTYSRGNNVKNAYLYGSTMNLLDASTPQPPNSLVLEYRSFKITYNLVAGNTYYFEATSTNPPETAEVYSYTFTITASTRPSSGANIDSLRAYTIQAGQTIDVDLSKGANSRWYSFIPAVSGTYTIQSSAVSNWDGYAPNAYLIYHDTDIGSHCPVHSTGIQLSYNSFLLTCNLIAGETYYLRATSDYAPGTAEIYSYTFSIIAPTSHNITYNSNGGSVSPTSTTVNLGSSVTTPTPTKNYTLTYNANNGSVSPSSKSVACVCNGWFTAASGGTKRANAGASYTPTQNETIYAQWMNPTMGSLAIPTRTGYTFNGWFTASNGGEPVTNETTMTGNTTIYAQWALNIYTIAYGATGGENAPASQEKTHNVTLVLSSERPTRNGYTFIGWSTSSAATSASYQPGGNFTTNANTTLYAVWRADTYIVTYDVNGGSGTVSSQTKTHDVALALRTNRPTRTGYTFLGWATNSASTVAEYQPGDSFTLNAETTLFAVWQENTYSVKYNANGGSGTMAESTHTYGTASTLTPNAFTRAGYTFAGWATSSSGSVVYADAASVLNLTSTSGGTFNLYAKWTAVPTYTLTVNNGAGGGSFEAGTTVTITANTVPTGQRFKQWNVSPAATFTGGTSATSATAQFAMPAGAVTATATYEAIPAGTYAVAVNSGTGGGSYAADATVTVTANTAPSGQRFKQWNISLSVSFTGGTSATSATAKFTMPSQAVTATAVFEPIPTTTYALTVVNGTGGGNHAVGATVTITANAAPSGQVFDKWTATAGTLANANSATTTFTMPAGAATVTASYKAATTTPANKTALNNRINEIGSIQKGNYTDASWQAFQNALDNARAVAGNDSATQIQVDAALNALNIAYAGLRENPPAKGIFGTNAKWNGAWWHYVLFFIGFGFIWMWF